MKTLRILSAAEQVAAHLREQLARGVWTGTMPGGDRLAPILGVGRMTVEAALRQLEDEGLLVSRGPGRAREIVLPGNLTVPALRVTFQLYEPGDRSLDYLLELQHQLQEAGHTVTFARKTLVELGMKLQRIVRAVGKSADESGSKVWIVCAASREVLEWFASRPEPAFAVFGRMRSVSIAGTGPDKVPALRATVRRLAELGHQRIVLLTREEHRKPRPGFFERAFLDELECCGIKSGPYNLPDWDESRASLHRSLESLFRYTPPTALIIDGAPLFIAARDHLARFGLLAPQHVSLVCSDPDPVFGWCEPEVTHIRWDSGQLVRRVVSWAANAARGKEDRRQTLSTAEFVEAGTIGPAPRGR